MSVGTLLLSLWLPFTVAATQPLSGAESRQKLSEDALVAALQDGGLVIVMRHASSPRETPDEASADPDNVNRERQLDEEGRETSRAMGDAVRALGIPVGPVLSSPTYRALETVKLAGLPEAETDAELGDRGRSMQGVTEEDAQWLRERAAQAPLSGTNVLIVTHSPNIRGAFPDVTPTPADGESLVFRPDGQGGAILIGRIRIEEWPELR